MAYRIEILENVSVIMNDNRISKYRLYLSCIAWNPLESIIK